MIKKLTLIFLLPLLTSAQTNQLQNLKEIDKKINDLLVSMPQAKETLTNIQQLSKKLVVPDWQKVQHERESFLKQKQEKELHDPEVQAINKKIEDTNAKFMEDLEKQKAQIKKETGRDVEFKVRPPQELTDLYNQKEKLLDPDNQSMTLQNKLRTIEEKYQVPENLKKLNQLHDQLAVLLNKNDAINEKINTLLKDRETILMNISPQDRQKKYPSFAVSVSLPFEEILLSRN